MERLFAVLHSQPVNDRSINGAAVVVAHELDDLWELGDARISRKVLQTIKAKVLEMRDFLRILRNKSKKAIPAYAEAVGSNCHYICIFH